MNVPGVCVRVWLPSIFFFPKGKVSCSFSNSSWYRVNCNQLAGGLVQSKHLERGDCTSRYPGAALAARPPPSFCSPCLLYASFMPSFSEAPRLSAMQLFICDGPSPGTGSPLQSAGPAHCGLASITAWEQPDQDFLMYSTRAQLCNRAGVWFPLRVPCAC